MALLGKGWATLHLNEERSYHHSLPERRGDNEIFGRCLRTELGATWTVQTKRSPHGADELVSVKCDDVPKIPLRTQHGWLYVSSSALRLRAQGIGRL